MIDTLANIKRQMLDMQERELQSVEKVKIGIEITEQANIDKTQVCGGLYLPVCFLIIVVIIRHIMLLDKPRPIIYAHTHIYIYIFVQNSLAIKTMYLFKKYLATTFIHLK